MNNGKKIDNYINNIDLKNTIKISVRNEILSLQNEAHLLKFISDIRKYLLSNGAYSDINMEKQNMQFEKNNVPKWEVDIINKSWIATKQLSHTLLKRLDLLNNMILEKDNNDLVFNKETIIDKLVSEVKKGIDNL